MLKLALVEMSLPGEYVVYQQQHSKESGESSTRRLYFSFILPSFLILHTYQCKNAVCNGYPQSHFVV